MPEPVIATSSMENLLERPGLRIGTLRRVSMRIAPEQHENRQLAG